MYIYTYLDIIVGNLFKPNRYFRFYLYYFTFYETLNKQK